MQQKQSDLHAWFRKTGYEQWVKREQRVIKHHREKTLTPDELRELQRFILEFGHFNANFTLSELEALLYPKTPTSNMAVHAYVRSHQSITADVLRHHYSVEHKSIETDNLYPVFIDAIAFWENVKHFCHVITVDDHFYQAPSNAVVQILTSTAPSESDIWVLLPTTLEGAKKHHQKASKRIRELRLNYLMSNVVPEDLRPYFTSSKGVVFREEHHQHLDQFLREQLTQLSQEEQEKAAKEKTYGQKTTKEKYKWITSKFGVLQKNNIAFLQANNIKTPQDLSLFVENHENFMALLGVIADIEKTGIYREAFDKKMAQKRMSYYRQAIDLWIKQQFEFFNDQIYFIIPHLEYQGIDTMVIVGHRESFKSDFAGPKQIVNRLGYRAESCKLIVALLKVYPALFIDPVQTRLFWDVLMSVSLVDGLPDSEKQLIEELPTKIQAHFTEKNTRQHLNKLIKSLEKAKCAEGRDIYVKVMMSMVTRLTHRGTQDSHPITSIIMCELVDYLFSFSFAITREDDFSFAQAVRALQSVGELLKLDLATTSSSRMPTSISTSIMRKLLKPYAVQQVVVSPYAMRSYLHVIRSSMMNLDGRTLKLAVTNQNYFESLLNLKTMRSSYVELTLVNNLYTDRFVSDVVITELDPNSATDKRLFQQNLKGLVGKLEEHFEHSDTRLTLVIDTTLNSVNHHEITDMLDRAKALIDKGVLNVVILQSLTKFSQLGLDQCNAGLTIIINNGVDWKVHNQYYKDLKKSQTMDTVSQRYFDFFASLTSGNTSRALSDHYIERIVKSTNSFYSALLKYAPNLGSGHDNLFKMVQTTEFHLCYVAFNTAGLLAVVDPEFLLQAHELEVFNHHLIDHLIIPICRHFQLPLTSRQSIGFVLSSLTVAMDSLRFTVGDESLVTIVRYASIMSYIVQYLHQHNDIASLFDRDERGKYSKRLVDLNLAAQRFCGQIDLKALLAPPSREGILYGPFEQNNEALYVARTSSQVLVYYRNRLIPSDHVAVYQYDCVTHLMKMTHDQLDFIFGSTAYTIKPLAPALMKRIAPRKTGILHELNMHYVPVIKDSLKFVVLQVGDPTNWICQMMYDELVATQKHVNVHQRAFGPGLYVIDIDHWGEKDPINARFLNFCIALYVKQRFHCDFKVRGIPGRDASMYQRFLFASHFDFDTLGGAVQEAVNMVEIHRDALLNHKNEYRKKVRAVHIRPFSFCRTPHWKLDASNTEYFTGPNAYPDASFVEEIFHILTISDRFEMLLDNKERKGIFSEPRKTISTNRTIDKITFFSSWVPLVPEESKNSGFALGDAPVPLIDFSQLKK